MDRLERWLDRRVNSLSSAGREAFFSLSDCRGATEKDGEEEKTALGIFFTNDMDFGGDAALFPNIARANHSCAPNADFVTRLVVKFRGKMTHTIKKHFLLVLKI